MLNLLIAVPIKADLAPALKAKAIELADALIWDESNNHIFEMDLCLYEDPGAERPQGAGRWWQPARARNDLLAANLQPDHELVLWIDADMVDYPADLPACLFMANPDGVTAPLVLIEGTTYFYDIRGFIQDGRTLIQYPPYFRNGAHHDDLVDLDSVGSLYLIPADVLRQARYESMPIDLDRDHSSVWATGHTEHMPVMRAAAAAGIRIACCQELIAYHAYLPKYGEGFH